MSGGMSDSSAQVPVLRSVQAAWGFFLSHWRRAVPAALIGALGGTVMEQGLAAAQAGAAPGGALLALFAGFAGVIVFQAALYRMALRPEESGQFGLALGSDELRLAGVTLALAAFIGLVMLVGFVTLMLVVGVVAAATLGPEAINQATIESQPPLSELLGPAGMVIFVIGMGALIAVAVWLGARLALAAPATVAERRYVLLASWPWTRGSALRIVGAALLAIAPVTAAFALMQSLVLSALPPDSGALLPIAFVIEFGAALTAGVVTVGLYAYLYQGLRPRRENA